MIGIVITIRKPMSDWLEMTSVLCFLFGIIITPVLGVAYLSNYYVCKADILAFEETRLTYNRTRENDENIEIAAIQLDIADNNRWLRRQQYWNETIFDIAIPDEIMKLEVIK